MVEVVSGELAVNCSTLVDLPRQTHGLRWMRDELMALPAATVEDVRQFQPSLSHSQQLVTGHCLQRPFRPRVLVKVKVKVMFHRLGSETCQIEMSHRCANARKE